MMPGMFTRFIRSLALILAAVLALAGAAAAQELEKLSIVTDKGRHGFNVEVMRTTEQRAQGLMNRRFLPQDRGMLFDFARMGRVDMWMENTYIPLDMIFIRQDGTIARIEQNTEPFSRRIISSGEPVLGVLEVNAGVTAKLGIEAGDKVEHPMFGAR